MNTFKNIKDAVLSLIDASQLSFAEIERRSGVARTQIYRWKSTEVTHPRLDSVQRIANILGYNIQIKDNKVTVQPHTDSSANRGHEMDLLIQTQAKLIEQYEEKIKMLEKEIVNIQKTQKDIDDKFVKMGKIPDCSKCLAILNRA